MARYRYWSRWLHLVTGLLTIVMVTLAGGVAASQEEGGEAPYYSDTQGPPQPGGIVNFLLYEDPDSLNPLVGQTTIAVQVVAGDPGGADLQRPGRQLPAAAGRRAADAGERRGLART